MDKAKISLKVDIYDRFAKKIAFSDVCVMTDAYIEGAYIEKYLNDVILIGKKYELWSKMDFNFQKKYNPEKKYLYCLILNEYWAPDEVLDYETKNEKMTDFVLLVKHDEIDWDTVEREAA